MDILIAKVGDEDRALAGERVKEFEHHFLLPRPRIGKEEVDLISPGLAARFLLTLSSSYQTLRAW